MARGRLVEERTSLFSCLFNALALSQNLLELQIWRSCRSLELRCSWKL